ncbi:hypothetical protein Pmani_028977 [Petrolisthes manimaculis]|uniref:Uncharacterized protein n=1 Tax=Petrolisthes manimaculis TaxID=1843537 RepID=A0AAE1NYH0_9EUCA|nr:hypothetical protein Pmani_028977 [Petrolisthes manimaculis]
MEQISLFHENIRDNTSGSQLTPLPPPCDEGNGSSWVHSSPARYLAHTKARIDNLPATHKLQSVSSAKVNIRVELKGGGEGGDGRFHTAKSGRTALAIPPPPQFVGVKWGVGTDHSPLLEEARKGMSAGVERATGRVHSYYTCAGMSILISPRSAGRVPLPGRTSDLGLDNIGL